MKYDRTLLNVAELFAQESYAERLKVGAVLADDEGRIVACGYNGTIAKTDNVCEHKVYVCKKCGKETYDDLFKGFLQNNICIECGNEGYDTCLKTKEGVLHAEQNVICYAARNGIATKGLTLYITHMPCIECSKLIVQCGIKRVVYKNEYRCVKGKEFLQQHNVIVELRES